jgi:dynein heavy chain, axonemal
MIFIFSTSRGEKVNQNLMHSIETVVIDWSKQIDEILKKDSSQFLLDGSNPDPLVEIDFWRSKTDNLSNIFEQLNDPRAKKMALLLKKTQSSYYPAYNELYTETYNAFKEALDIDAHLLPLISIFESIKSSLFDEITDQFDPMFHTICLLWANSKYYCKPSRIIILLQEVNNLIISCATEYLEPHSLFKMEPEDSVFKIKKTIEILLAYLKSYELHKSTVLTYFKNGIPAKDWNFASNLVTPRIDKFMERSNMILVIKNYIF